jgi:hypothetical protein
LQRDILSLVFITEKKDIHLSSISRSKLPYNVPDISKHNNYSNRFDRIFVFGILAAYVKPLFCLRGTVESVGIHGGNLRIIKKRNNNYQH